MRKRLGLVGVWLVSCQAATPPASSLAPPAARPAAVLSALPRVNLPITPAGAEAELNGARPVPVEEERVVAIATALWAACALLESGNVWCWGESHGQGSSDGANATRQVPLANVSKLAGAGERFFALTGSGSLFVWGQQQLLVNGPLTSAVPVAVPLGPVLDVAAGWDDFCALERGGRITCWDAAGTSSVAAVLPTAQSLALSTNMTCARLGDGQVSCFGQGKAPAVRAGLTDVVELVAGGPQHCARRRDGSVSCWPEAAAPQFGGTVSRLQATPHAICAFQATGLPACQALKSGGKRDEPVLLPAQLFPAASALTDASLGPQHGCAVLNGRAWCWGEDSFGALGAAGSAWELEEIRRGLRDAPTADQQVLARVTLGDTAALRQAAQIAVGGHHQCIVTLGGRLRCWGNNDWGQLGVDPARGAYGIVSATDLNHVAQLTLADSTSCARLENGELYCWGRQAWRKDLPTCGDADDTAPCSAQPALLATGVVQAGLGNGYGCLLNSDYKVLCWGDNAQGQLGSGTTKPSATPERVLGEDGKPLGAVAKLRVFAGHACAIGAAGKLWCWGDNSPMTQGRRYNSAPKLTRATSFPGLPAVRDVSDRCVLGLANELRCWGEVFDDTKTFSYEPVRVGHCGVKQLVSGPGRCFVDADGLSCLDWAMFEGDVWHNGLFRAGYEVKSFAGSETQICAVDANSQVACSLYEGSSLLPLIGGNAGQLLMTDVRTPGCPLDAAPTSLPSFPPVLPARVTVSASADTVERLHLPELTKQLSPGQVARLLRLLNQREDYTRIATCHDPEFEFTLLGAQGETQGVVSVGSCSTLEVYPQVPAQRGMGNVIESRLSGGLRQLCREAGLRVCEEDPP